MNHSIVNYNLDQFVANTRDRIAKGGEPADFVESISRYMYQLLNGDKSFLKPEHYTANEDNYARNAIYIADDNSMSLYALVWLPGQWTPIHDHGTWGVVGVSEGTLEERNFIRIDEQDKAETENIELVRGGVIMLAPGAVTSFVPNPDHIHFTGNGDAQKRVVSLHLYGHAMAGFNIYDRGNRTKQWVEVKHNES